MAPRAARAWGLAAGVAMAACRPSRPSPSPSPYLVQKGPYQALYDGGGRLQRLLYDPKGRGKAQLLAFYAPDGRLLRAEIDTDGDDVVDRWEFFDANGSVEKVGLARCRPGQADEWWFPADAGGIVRVERDEDGDGRVDHWIQRARAQIVLEEFDTDGDGRPDQRVARDASPPTRRPCARVAAPIPRR